MRRYFDCCWWWMRCHLPSFLKHFFVFVSFIWLLSAAWRLRANTTVEMFLQEFKTKEEVKAFFVQWAAKKKDKDGFRDLNACIEQLSRQDREDLLVHVTRDNRTAKEFCDNWTNCPTHILGSILYVNLREWLGAGKGERFVSLDVMM